MNGCAYSRDIGRSSVISNRAFFQFGDTFCKDLLGNYVGVTSHTCSRLCWVGNPEVSEYINIDPDGKVASFIPLTTQELALDQQHADQKERITLWSFGGIAEDGPMSGRGWCWFEKGRTVGAQITHWPFVLLNEC